MGAFQRHLECPLIYWGQGLEVGQQLVHHSMAQSSRNSVFSNLTTLRVLQSVYLNYGTLLWASSMSSNLFEQSFGARSTVSLQASVKSTKISQNELFSNFMGLVVHQCV